MILKELNFILEYIKKTNYHFKTIKTIKLDKIIKIW